MKTLKGGMTRDEMEEAAAMDGSKRSPNMPPRDASTLIVLDGEGGKTKVLMGRRSLKHKFMPGLFVFPGGRVDRFDGSAPAASELHPVVEEKIVNTLKKRPSKRRARALGLASIRETYEETGLLLGKNKPHTRPIDHRDWSAFAEHEVMPDLADLRLIARAITPPGRTRRFDAWFFTARAETIAHRLPDLPTQELEDIHWLTLDDALKLDLPVITVTVLKELQERLSADPDLKPETDLPFFHLRGKQFLRDLI